MANATGAIARRARHGRPATDFIDSAHNVDQGASINCARGLYLEQRSSSFESMEAKSLPSLELGST
jgi:hypothetical protein